MVRPDTSRVRGYRANGPGLSGVAAEQAAVENDAPPVARAARLGGALAGFAEALAAVRRELAVLKRENNCIAVRACCWAASLV